MLGAAANTIMSSQLPKTNKQYFQTLPDDVVNHLASMLPMYDFLKLRGVDSRVYDQIDLRGAQQACLARLTPGFVTRVRTQRNNRLVYLGLRLTNPPTQTEIEALAEFEGLRGVKSLELQMAIDQAEVNAAAHRDAKLAREIVMAIYDDEEDRHELEQEAGSNMRNLEKSWDQRALSAGNVSHRALALELVSLCFRGSALFLSFVVPCVLANRGTLQHLALSKMYHASNARNVIPELDMFVDVVLHLVSLRMRSALAGVTQLIDTNDARASYRISSVSGKQSDQPTWQYLSLLDAYGYEPTEFLPLVLPDTLQGLALLSSRSIAWTCPSRVEYLRITASSNIPYVLDTHIPPHHDSLTQLVLDVSCYGCEDELNIDMKALESWLQGATLPALNTLAVYMLVTDLNTIKVISAISRRFPHLQRIYLDIEQLENEERVERMQTEKQSMNLFERSSLRAHKKLRKLKSDLSIHTQLIQGPLPDLEASFLLSHNLSMVSPCTDAIVIVERGSDKHGDAQRIINLQPLHSRTGNSQHVLSST
jgi:hypothetical protein